MDVSIIRHSRSLLILAMDLVAFFAIITCVYFIRLDRLPDFLSLDLWLIAATFISILLLSGTYFRSREIKPPSLPIHTFWVCLIAGFVCLIWLYLLGPTKFTEYFGRGILPAVTVIFGFATTFIRYFINSAHHFQSKNTKILYLGYSSSASAFLKEYERHSELYSISLITKQPSSEEFKHVKTISLSLREALNASQWQSIIVDPLLDASSSQKDDLIAARLSGVPILSLADFYEKFWYMVPVHDIDDDWFLRSQGFSMLDNHISKRIKRIVDIIAAILLLLLSAPLMAICGALIKATSKGPILFQQDRVGLQGAIFTIYKLRTMQDNAEEDGAQWTTINDPRITKFGNFLRQTRLDEIPQCWNVLSGSMSFVGPRPERPEFTSQLSKKIPYYDLRHLVKPGITGWAQVIFPYGSSMDDALKKLQYELYYIKNQSFVLDLNILVRTLITVFKRAGR